MCRCGRDHIVVGFTTTCAISAYPTNVMNLNPAHDELYLIQHYVIKFVSDIFPGNQVSATNKTYSDNVAEILLKVVLNTLTP